MSRQKKIVIEIKRKPLEGVRIPLPKRAGGVIWSKKDKFSRKRNRAGVRKKIMQEANS